MSRPAACDTIKQHFLDTATKPYDYDLIVTGDLGQVGGELLKELLLKDGYNLRKNYRDCGIMRYNLSDTDMAAGGSGYDCERKQSQNRFVYITR